MNNINNEQNKEYVKYKDGKVISVKDELSPKMSLFEEINLYIRKQRSKKFTLNDLKKVDIKKFSFKSIFLVFILFSSLLFYIFYFTDLIPAKDVTPKPSGNGSLVENVIKDRVDKVTGNNDSSLVPGNKEVTDKSDNAKGEDGKTFENSNQKLIHFTEDLNITIYNKHLDENRKVRDYIGNKQNRTTILNSLNKFMIDKENMYLLLVTNKELFELEDNLDLYEILEQRLITSIKKTETINDLITGSSSNKAIEEKITNFNENDTIFNDTYNIKLIEFLDLQNIKYEKIKHNVKFNLADIN